MKEFNILFTSAGRRVSLIKNFQQTLDSMGLKGKIITSDMKKNIPAALVSDYHEIVPRVLSNNYINIIKEICYKYNVSLVIPLIDTELYLLASHKLDFEKMGVTILVSSSEVNEICLDKRKTYNFFRNIGVDTPEIFDPDKILNDPNALFPYFIKPADGSSSIGVTKINNRNELRFFKDYVSNAIVQEFIEGEEYTSDVLVDFQGKVLSIVPRLRIETRAGEVSKGMTVKNSFIIESVKKVIEALPGASGVVTVQSFLTKEGKIKFIEINPRFGGGIPLSIKAGADFPRWIIKMILKEKIKIAIDDWEDGVVMLRYDKEIFSTKEDIE